ncbi:hypothetical protein WA158_005355 [Blastocystis sp. Blastoise]
MNEFLEEIHSNILQLPTKAYGHPLCARTKRNDLFYMSGENEMTFYSSRNDIENTQTFEMPLNASSIVGMSLNAKDDILIIWSNDEIYGVFMSSTSSLLLKTKQAIQFPSPLVKKLDISQVGEILSVIWYPTNPYELLILLNQNRIYKYNFMESLSSQSLFIHDRMESTLIHEENKQLLSISFMGKFGVSQFQLLCVYNDYTMSIYFPVFPTLYSYSKHDLLSIVDYYCCLYDEEEKDNSILSITRDLLHNSQEYIPPETVLELIEPRMSSPNIILADSHGKNTFLIKKKENIIQTHIIGVPGFPDFSLLSLSIYSPTTLSHDFYLFLYISPLLLSDPSKCFMYISLCSLPTCPWTPIYIYPPIYSTNMIYSVITKDYTLFIKFPWLSLFFSSSTMKLLFKDPCDMRTLLDTIPQQCTVYNYIDSRLYSIQSILQGTKTSLQLIYNPLSNNNTAIPIPSITALIPGPSYYKQSRTIPLSSYIQFPSHVSLEKQYLIYLKQFNGDRIKSLDALSKYIQTIHEQYKKNCIHPCSIISRGFEDRVLSLKNQLNGIQDTVYTLRFNANDYYLRKETIYEIANTIPERIFEIENKLTFLSKTISQDSLKPLRHLLATLKERLPLLRDLLDNDAPSSPNVSSSESPVSPNNEPILSPLLEDDSFRNALFELRYQTQKLNQEIDNNCQLLDEIIQSDID